MLGILYPPWADFNQSSKDFLTISCVCKCLKEKNFVKFFYGFQIGDKCNPKKFGDKFKKAQKKVVRLLLLAIVRFNKDKLYKDKEIGVKLWAP